MSQPQQQQQPPRQQGQGQGGGPQQQQQQQQQQQRPPMGAWQPAAPTSLQMAAAVGVVNPAGGPGQGGSQQQQQQQQQQQVVVQGQGQPSNHPQHPQHQQQQQQQQPMQQPSYGYNTVPSQQQYMNPYATYNPYMSVQPQGNWNPYGAGAGGAGSSGRGGGGGGGPGGGRGGGGHSWSPAYVGGPGGRGGGGGPGSRPGGNNNNNNNVAGGNPYAGAAAAVAGTTTTAGGNNGGGNPYQPQGGMFYPPTPPGVPPGVRPGEGGGVVGQAPPSVIVPPQPRIRKALVITDKEGNVIDLSGTAGAKKAAAAAAAAAATSTSSSATSSTTPATKESDTSSKSETKATTTTMSSSDAGAKLRQAALDAIQGKDKQRQQQQQQQEEEKKKKLQEEEKAKAEAAAAEAAKEEAEAAAAKKKKEEDEIATAAAKLKAEQEEAAASAAEKEAKAKAAEASSVAESVKKDAAPPSAKVAKSSLASLLSRQQKSVDGMGTIQTDSGTAATATASSTTTTTSSVKPTTNGGKKKRHVHSKEELMRLRELPVCKVRPVDLPEFVITNGPSRGGGVGGSGGAGADRESREARDARRGSQRNTGGSGGGGGGGDWQRGAPPPPRRTSQQQKDGSNAVNSPPGGPNAGGGNSNNPSNDGGGQWARGQAPPPPPPQRAPHPGGRGGGRGGRGGGRGDQGSPYFDGPVAPLVKSKNGWRPRKETSSLVVAEKKVKSILNKMTKENFARLCDQMCEIPVTSHDILTMMISNVYEKAIDEPSFGEIYGDLCVKLSIHVQSNSFVKIIESDEEPPTEDDQEPAAPAGSSGGAASSYIVYRWSNDVSTSDSEIVGPFGSIDECLAMALSSETQQDPINRNDMELELVKLQIKNGVFIKVMKKKSATSKAVKEGAPEDGEVREEELSTKDEFYTVFFPVSDHVECGQQLSQIFLSERECVSDANKQNSFKRSLLNKCEDEFNKQDIYVEWKKEKAAYEESKHSLSASEQAEKEEELDFRRIKIKKQMLGNIKFIGQLYKKNLLKERIMRFCIASLLKLETKDSKSKLPQYYDTGDTDIDEEDHEALCNMFATIGKTIDRQPAVDFMKVCFDKIEKLSVNPALPMRSRFMYKDLLDLRANGWVPRRKEGKAMTLEEVRKEVEREERLQAQQSAQLAANTNYRGGGGGTGGGGSRNDFGGGRSTSTGGGDYRSNNPRQTYGSNNINSNNRFRSGKQNDQTDDDGFATVGGSKPRSSLAQAGQQPQRILQKGNRPGFSSLAEAADLSISASSPSKSSSFAPLDMDAFERRVNTIRIEYKQEPTNLKDLMLSLDELSGTENYGSRFVSLNVDRIIDVKDDERKSIYSLLSVLAEKRRISSDDVKIGLTDFIEFIDSYVFDAPLVFDYLGELLSNMIRVKAIDVTWVGEQAEKTKVTDESNPEKIVRALIGAIKTAGGVEAVKGAFAPHQKKMEALLGPAKWAALKQEV